jgi:hypothetical protein
MDSPTRISLEGRPGNRVFELRVIHENSKFSGNPKKLGKLFERGTDSQGAGVGLYLVGTLMRIMKGSASFLPSDGRFETLLVFSAETEEANRDA